jgi:hypothetical protein
VRTVYLVRVDSTAIDKTWNGFNVFVTGMAELNIGIMCACAPSTQHFMRRYGQSATSKMRSVTGLGTGGRSLPSPRMKGSMKLLDSGMGSVAMEVMSEKGSDLGDARKYRPTASPTAPRLSPASSQSPLTSAHRGASRSAVRPGVMYSRDDDYDDTYDGRVGPEDWTNTSKLVV